MFFRLLVTFSIPRGRRCGGADATVVIHLFPLEFGCCTCVQERSIRKSANNVKKKVKGKGCELIQFRIPHYEALRCYPLRDEKA